MHVSVVLGASLLLRYSQPKDGAMEDSTPHERHPTASHMYCSEICSKWIMSDISCEINLFHESNNFIRVTMSPLY
jgi:hypothetical protein